MTLRRAVAVGLVLLLWLSARGASAQTLTETLTRLNSDSLPRGAALEQLLDLGAPRAEPYNVRTQVHELLRKYPRDADRISMALIRSLEHERTRSPSSARALTEEESEYIPDNIAAVAALKDPRALTALIGVIETGGMATDGIADLGEIAVGPILGLLRAGPSRNSAAITLKKLLDRRVGSPLSAGTVSTIRTALVAALADENRFVRTMVVEALDAFADADVRARMEQLAANDPFRAPNGHFLVREAATAWLAKHKSD